MADNFKAQGEIILNYALTTFNWRVNLRDLHLKEEVGTVLRGRALLLGALPAHQKLSPKKGNQWPLCTQPDIIW